MSPTGSAGSGARSGYVRGARALRGALHRVGALQRWDRQVGDRPGTLTAHLRTLLSVYDARELARFGLPWWTYPATEAVERFLTVERGGGARVFEFGSGASTVWLARRSAELVSVEHDVRFADTVRGLLAEHHVDATLHVATPIPSTDPVVPSTAHGQAGLDFADYVETLGRVGGRFDLVVVDGRARGACLKAALQHLAAGGIALLDDAQRRRYAPALEAAECAGYVVQRMRGLAPTVPVPRVTALLHRRP